MYAGVSVKSLLALGVALVCSALLSVDFRSGLPIGGTLLHGALWAVLVVTSVGVVCQVALARKLSPEFKRTGQSQRRV